MGFMSTPIIGTDPIRQLLSTEQPVRFDHRPFPMDPFGLNRVEPRAFTRQPTCDNAHATPLLFDLAVMRPQPLPHSLALMPRSIVPHQQQGTLAQAIQAVTAPGQKLGREGTDGLSRGKPQPELFWSRGGGPQQQSIAGQSLGVGIIFGRGVFRQAPRLPLRRPGMQGGLRQATPPDLITKAKHPRGMGGCQVDQAVPLFFFRAYAGSGLVIQRLARRQLTPSRRSASRIASPLTCRGRSPAAYATWAARGKVQRLVGWPKVRGLWCSRSRNRSRRVVSNTAWGVWCGAEEPGRSAANPWPFKAGMALR